MYLLYGIDIDVIKTDRSPRKTDWNKFAILVQSNVKSQCKKENLSTKDKDEEIGQLSKIFNKSYTSPCPVCKETIPP